MDSKRSSNPSSIAPQVAEHYNNVTQKTVKERARSDIIGVRKFNNAMKSLMHQQALKFVLLNDYSASNIRVLDLGCGKGGDLQKYQRHQNISLVVGVDIASVSIEQCNERYKLMKPYNGRKIKGIFFEADLTKEDIKPKLVEHEIYEKFHMASSQFSLHYSFESFEQAVRYISNAADNLMQYGIFVGTYPDGPKLLKLARESKTRGSYEVEDVLSVRFAPEDLDNPKPFGTKYHFKLKEVVDCPEFLVHPTVLKSLMESLGFFQIFDRSFKEALDQLRNNHNDKPHFWNIIRDYSALKFDEHNKIARLDQISWGAVSIYRCFCYKKI